MRLSLAFLVAFGVAGPVARAADPALLELIMPEAKVMFGANLERILNSPIGKNFAAGMRSGAGSSLPALIAATGFDPSHDLQEILIASGGGPKDGPVILLRGSFDTERLASLAMANGGRPESYEGVRIIGGTAGKTPGGFALLDRSIAVVGPLEQVRAAIRRRGKGARLDVDLAAKVAALSAKYDLWAFSTMPAAGLAARVPDSRVSAASDMLKSIEQFSGGVKLDSSVELAAQILARTDRDAQRLGDGLQAIVVMMQHNQQATCPDCLKVRVEDATVHVSLIVPEALVRQTLEARNKPAPPPPAANTDILIQSSPTDMGTVKLPRP